jgi:hypothetical protein
MAIEPVVNGQKQQMLLVLLLSVLSFSTSDTLTKLTRQPIQTSEEFFPTVSPEVLFTATEVWYRSTTNETIRLSHPEQPLLLPAPLLPYRTEFVELSNNRVLLYAGKSTTSIPFYVTDGVTTTQYSHLQIPGQSTLRLMQYVSSHGNDYVISVFASGSQTRYTYVAYCTCLNSQTSVALGYGSHLVTPAADAFYMLARGRLLRYDPYLNTTTNYDSFSGTVLSLSLVGNYLIFQSNTNTILKHDTVTGLSVKLKSEFRSSYVNYAVPLPSTSDPKRFGIVASFNLILCPGESTECTVPLNPVYEFSQLPPDNIALIANGNLTRLISYSLPTDQVEELYHHLEMPKKSASNSNNFRYIEYDNVSDSVVMIGTEMYPFEFQNHCASMQLLRVDLKTKTLYNSTEMCVESCYHHETLLQVRNGSIWVIKKNNGEQHLYQVNVENPPVPTPAPTPQTTKPPVPSPTPQTTTSPVPSPTSQTTTSSPTDRPTENPVNVALIVGLSAGAVALVLVAVAVIGIVVWFRKRSTAEPYAPMHE